MTKPLASLYKEINFGNNKIHRKLLPKNIEMFYDEVIEKNENEKWHIVTNKRERKEDGNKKVLGSISTVKNNKLNIIFSEFIVEKLSIGSNSI